MWGDTKQASSATTSLIYITLGALTAVWSGIYYFYLRGHGGTDVAYLYVSGFFLTGVVLFLIGIAVGRIGYAARPAEVAPTPTAQVISSAPSVVPTVTTGASGELGATVSPAAVAGNAVPNAQPVAALAPAASGDAHIY
jgi:hypothetical protein